jgi:hypothetical protein
MLMGMTTTTSTRLDIRSWDEQPYRELSDGRVLKRAEVALSGGGDGATVEGQWNALLYYHPDGTSTYVGFMHATGTLDGRTGSFVMVGQGTFDGTTARMTSDIIPGSGTDGLAGITGRAEHESTHADYPQWPLVLRYDLD